MDNKTFLADKMRIQQVAILAVCAAILGFLQNSPTYAQPSGLSNRTKAFTDPAQMTGRETNDPAELARSWAAAMVQIPNKNGGSRISSIAALRSSIGNTGTKYPTIIYLHGCSGFWKGTRERVKFYAEQGYLVIAPASFARLKYPQSCNPATKTGGLYRGTLAMRQADAGYAIEMVRKFPFVDQTKIILAGLSQGAITTATFKAANRNQKTTARIIEGWTCNARWPEYRGINAGPEEAVLTLVAKYDPWFQNEWTKGDCGKFLNPDNGSISVVYNKGKLAYQHELLKYSPVRKRVLDFLETLSGPNRR